MINLPPPTYKIRNIALILLSSLPLSAVYAGNIFYEGTVDGNGNTTAGVNSDKTVEDIFVVAHGKPNLYDRAWYQTYTTEALIANYGSTLKATGVVHIVNTSPNGGGKNDIDNNGANYALNGSTIDFSGAESVYLASIGGKQGANDDSAISAKQNMGNDANATNRVEITNVKGPVQIIGSLDVSPSLAQIFGLASDNRITVELSGSDSFWYGSAAGEGAGREVHVTLSDGARWIFNASGSALNQDGNISHLGLNDGIVILADELIYETYNNTYIPSKDENDPTKDKNYLLADYRDANAAYATVDIGNLSGKGGTFLIDLDWLAENQGQKTYADDGTSDFIKIGTVEDRSHQFVSFDQSKAHLDEMNVGDKLYFASVETGTTTFTTSADGETNSADELYTFDYSTQSEVDTDDKTYWFLTKSLGHANENTSLLKSAALASYSLASDLDRFNERRGQSRHADRGSDGLWVRYRYSSVSLDEAFDMDKNMIQVGYDKDVSSADSRKFVGVAFDYTRGDTDIDGISASGDNDRYGLNLYYTVLADCGGYADFNAKIGRIGSDYDARNSVGQDIGASFWQTYYGLSAEVGYKYDFAKSLFVEPQAQLQVMRIEGDNFSTNGGVNAAIEDTNSVIGRLGFRAGYQFSFSESLPDSSVYVVADVLREFKGDTAFQAIGRTTSYDYEQNGHETWFDAGLGADISVSQNTKLWLDTKYVFGGEFENTWALNAGVRWEFI